MDPDSIMGDGVSGPSKRPAAYHSPYGASHILPTRPNGGSGSASVPRVDSRASPNIRSESLGTSTLAFSTTDTNGKLLEGSKNSDEAANLKNTLRCLSLPTGLCYDVRMRFHSELQPRKDNVHPEDPRRIFAIYKDLCDAGLVEDPMTPGPLRQDLLLRIPARQATEAEICLVHTKSHYNDMVRTKCKLSKTAV